MKTQKATTAATKEAKKSKQPTNKDARAAKVARKHTAPKGARESKDARPGSKKDIVLKLLRRDQGATIAELAKPTDWQNHSIRGFLSAQVTKKMKLKVESTKSEAGERTYRIVT